MTRLTNRGTTVGYIDEGTGSDGQRRVLDANQKTVGYISDRGTFDEAHRQIADYPDVGMLLAGDD